MRRREPICCTAPELNFRSGALPRACLLHSLLHSLLHCLLLPLLLGSSNVSSTEFEKRCGAAALSVATPSVL